MSSKTTGFDEQELRIEMDFVNFLLNVIPTYNGDRKDWSVFKARFETAQLIARNCRTRNGQRLLLEITKSRITGEIAADVEHCYSIDAIPFILQDRFHGY